MPIHPGVQKEKHKSRPEPNPQPRPKPPSQAQLLIVKLQSTCSPRSMKINDCFWGNRDWGCLIFSMLLQMHISFRSLEKPALTLRAGQVPTDLSDISMCLPNQSHIWLWELLLNFFPLHMGTCQSCSQQSSSWPQGLAQTRCALYISWINSGLTAGRLRWAKLEYLCLPAFPQVSRTNSGSGLLHEFMWASISSCGCSVRTT